MVAGVIQLYRFCGELCAAENKNNPSDFAPIGSSNRVAHNDRARVGDCALFDIAVGESEQIPLPTRVGEPSRVFQMGALL